MENHEDIAVVRSIQDKIAQVEIERTGSCEGCAVSGFCNSDKKIILHKIKIDQDLKVGDKVQVNIATSLRIFSSFVVFIIPIITMLSFYLISKYILALNEDLSIVTSMIGLLLSGILIYFIDKKFADKLSFTIIKKL